MDYEDLIFGIATANVPYIEVCLILALIFDYVRTMIFSNK